MTKAIAILNDFLMVAIASSFLCWLASLSTLFRNLIGLPDRPSLRSPTAESPLSTVDGIKERDRIKLNLSSGALDKLLDKLEKRNWLRFLEIKIPDVDRP